MTAPTTQLADYSSIATQLRSRFVHKSPERVAYACAVHSLIATGRRPCASVVVMGIDGLSVRLVVDGLGTIAHVRTRRRAREIARASVAAVLDLDPYAFDLQVDGA